MRRHAINPEFVDVNIDRCNRWHTGGLDDWTLAEWNQAVTGEWGEACNAAKKLKRVQDGIANLADHGTLLEDEQEARAKFLEECADTFIYLTIAATAATGNPYALSEAITEKFNRTSKLYGFPEHW